MFNIGIDWNPKQAKLKSIILKPDYFEEAIALSLELHSIVHEKEMSSSETITFADEVFHNISHECFCNITYDKIRTFAYNVWHITRIEDICANILIADDIQVINTNNWLDRLNCTITDTGNALLTKEIADFSQRIDQKQLFEYRVAVGEKTRKVLKSLQPKDMKTKMNNLRLKRILDEKAVSKEKEAVWLIDFWGKKSIAGLIQMPILRHQVVHLNDCLKIKKKCKII